MKWLVTILLMAVALGCDSNGTAVEEEPTYAWEGTWAGILHYEFERNANGERYRGDDIIFTLTEDELNGMWTFIVPSFDGTPQSFDIHGHVVSAGTDDNGIDYFNVHIATGAFGYRFAGWMNEDGTLSFMRFGNILDAWYGAGTIVPEVADVKILTRVN